MVCGAPPDSDGIGEYAAAIEQFPRSPGWRMRVFPNHLPMMDRNEGEAYVPSCSCGEVGPAEPDLRVATNWWSGHLNRLQAEATETTTDEMRA